MIFRSFWTATAELAFVADVVRTLPPEPKLRSSFRTIASAYSIRPTSDARASAPMTWDEVPDCDPAAFTLTAMRDRIDVVGDLTAGMWRRKVSLRPKFAKLGLEPPA